MEGTKKVKSVSYAKWGYVFVAPFIIVYLVFQLFPLLSTFYYSFTEYYFSPGTFQYVGPTWIGFDNYKAIFTPDNQGKIDLFTYLGNTMIMWIIGAVPQLIFSLLLAVVYTNNRIKVKGQRFFKTVMYMPNLIMAAAFGMLFFKLFSPVGPINQMLGRDNETAIRFFDKALSSQVIVASINFLMWFGNTAILLMAGIMGIDGSIFEAAEIDGASSWQTFWKITIPLLMPIMVYVLITSLIGGLQMYDVPAIIGGAEGQPAHKTTTLIMYLNSYLNGLSKDKGRAGAISVLVFIITGILSLIVYKAMYSNREDTGRKKKKKGV